MNDSETRRLVAILAADAVGYSTRVASDEIGAIRAIKACLDIMDRTIALQGGRIVKTLGDGLIAEFTSVIHAVSAGAAIQDEISARNERVPEQAQFQFRIGIHMGDVIADGDDILGEGVNIAARLEAAATPGGLLVSSRVHEEIMGRLPLEFEDRGKITLKGFPTPVQVFGLGDAPSEPGTIERLVPDDKPSIAVLPFVNMSSDPEQDFFADGLTEDIITSLSTVPWLFVVARNSSFIFKGADADVARVGSELGVRYVLRGNVRRSGPRLRVSGHLVETGSGTQLWADRFDGSTEDVFDLQDRITEATAGAIAPQVQVAEQVRVARKQPESLTAYDQLLQAMAAINRARIGVAIDHLDRAIEINGNYSKALAMRGWVHTLQIGWQGTEEFEHHKTAALELTRRSLEAGSEDPETVAFANYTLGWFTEDVDQCLHALRTVAHQCPSFAWAWASYGMLEGLQGNPLAGIEPSEHAIRLSPKDPMGFRAYLAKSASLIYAERFDDHILSTRQVLAQNPNVFTAAAQLVWSLFEVGDYVEHGKALEQLYVRFPEASVTRYRLGSGHFLNFLKDQENIERRLLAAGLKR